METTVLRTGLTPREPAFVLAVGSAGGRSGDRAALCRLICLVASRRRLEPCLRFSRTRLTDIVHRLACAVVYRTNSRSGSERNDLRPPRLRTGSASWQSAGCRDGRGLRRVLRRLGGRCSARRGGLRVGAGCGEASLDRLRRAGQGSLPRRVVRVCGSLRVVAGQGL